MALRPRRRSATRANRDGSRQRSSDGNRTHQSPSRLTISPRASRARASSINRLGRDQDDLVGHGLVRLLLGRKWSDHGRVLVQWSHRRYGTDRDQQLATDRRARTWHARCVDASPNPEAQCHSSYGSSNPKHPTHVRDRTPDPHSGGRGPTETTRSRSPRINVTQHCADRIEGSGPEHRSGPRTSAT